MTTNQTFKVTYTKAVGGNGTIIVKAQDAETAIKRAERHCFTGSNFRDAQLTNDAYSTPYQQGYTHTLSQR